MADSPPRGCGARLSSMGFLALACSVVVIVATLVSSWSVAGALAGLLAVLAAVGVLAHTYLRRCRPHPTLADGHLDDHVIRMFSGGLVPMTLCALLAEAVLTAVGSLAILGLTARDATILQEIQAAQLAGEDASIPRGISPGLKEWLLGEMTPRVLLFLIFTSFCVAACVEESLKWCMLRVTLCFGNHEYSCCLQPRGRRPARSTLVLMVAVAAGFSLIETLLYIRAAPSDVESQVVTAVLRSCSALPLHIIGGLWTGVRLARRDVKDKQFVQERLAEARSAAVSGGTPRPTSSSRGVLARLAAAREPVAVPAERPRKCGSNACIIAPAVLVHGLYDMVALGVPKLFADKSTGWVPPEAGITVLVVCFCVAFVAALALAWEIRAVLAEEASLDAHATDGETRPGPAPAEPVGAAAVALTLVDQPRAEASSGAPGRSETGIELTPYPQPREEGRLLQADPQDGGAFSDGLGGLASSHCGDDGSVALLGDASDASDMGGDLGVAGRFAV